MSKKYVYCTDHEGVPKGTVVADASPELEAANIVVAIEAPDAPAPAASSKPAADAKMAGSKE